MTTIPTYRHSKKYCKVCNREFHPIRTTDRYCSMKCAYSEKKRGPAKQIKRQPIAKVSKKRAAQNKIYYPLRKEFLRLHPDCMIRTKECTGKATEIHHSYDGCDRDKYYLDISTWFGACRRCHNWVGNFPQAAKTLGFLK